MFVSVLILLFKAWGDCVNPTSEDCAGKTTSATCNAAGTGCRYETGNLGTCRPQTLDACVVKEQSACTGGCTWDGVAACVRASHPECTIASGACSTGCETSLTQRIRCISYAEARVIECANEANCADNNYCKVENSKCVPKTDLDRQTEECGALGAANADACQIGQVCDGTVHCIGGTCTCSGGSFVTQATQCKFEGGVCKGRTDEEYEAAFCAYQGANGTGGCAGNSQCKVSGTNCVPKTPQEQVDWYCGNAILLSNCSDAAYSGMCQLVGGACVGDPAYFNADYTVVCSLDGTGTQCDTASLGGCTTFPDYPCVLKSCSSNVGNTACSADSEATGCVWQGSGSCKVNAALTTCGPANQECNPANVTAGCASTGPVTAACLPKAELECAGAGKCSSSAIDVGCKTVTKNVPSSASAMAIPMIVFVVLALFL